MYFFWSSWVLVSTVKTVSMKEHWRQTYLFSWYFSDRCAISIFNYFLLPISICITANFLFTDDISLCFKGFILNVKDYAFNHGDYVDHATLCQDWVNLNWKAWIEFEFGSDSLINYAVVDWIHQLNGTSIKFDL